MQPSPPEASPPSSAHQACNPMMPDAALAKAGVEAVAHRIARRTAKRLSQLHIAAKPSAGTSHSIPYLLAAALDEQ